MGRFKGTETEAMRANRRRQKRICGTAFVGGLSKKTTDNYTDHVRACQREHGTDPFPQREPAQAEEEHGTHQPKQDEAGEG